MSMRMRYLNDPQLVKVLWGVAPDPYFCELG